ncbi:MAG: GxxExxY protein [Proteobacteria bacterium]|nr:GxxExxY protein [Pseudomonadota bacterium]
MILDGNGWIDAELTERVIGVFYSVYNELQPGFVESVYENALAFALREDGLHVEQQTPLSVTFRGQIVGEFRADLVVERRLLIELKVVSKLNEAHEAQLLNYLKTTGLRIGLLLIFGPEAQVKRRVFNPKNPLLSASIRSDLR